MGRPPALHVIEYEAEYGPVDYRAATEHVERGDVVSVEFDNRYDKRFSPRSDWTGEVTHVDRSPTGGGTVVLTLEHEDGDELVVGAHGAVRIRRVGDLKSKAVGEVAGSVVLP